MTRRFLAFAFLAILPSAVQASTLYDAGPLSFETKTAQSMWGSGSATRFEGSEFLGVGIGGSTTVGGVSGGVTSTTIITNPLWFAWKACKSTVNILCGDEPSKKTRTVTVDTRTGAKLTASSAGKIGAEVDYLLDGGSVNASLKHSATAVLPTSVRVGEAFSLNPMAEWTEGTLSAQTPTAEASVGTYVDVELSVDGEFCFIGTGCVETGKVKILDTGVKRQEIVGIDPGGVRYLDGFIPGVTIEHGLLDQTAELSAGVSVSGPTVTVTVQSEDADGNTKTTTYKAGVPIDISTSVGSAGIEFPVASGSASLAGGEIALALRSDFLNVKADVDALVPIIPAGGLSVGLGPLTISADAYDVDVGPKLDVFQNLSLKSDLYVDLLFDRDVDVAGVGLSKSWSGLWKDLPDFSVLGKTVFTPVFSVVSELVNRTGLSLGFELTAELFKLAASVDFGIVNVLDAKLGPLFAKTIPFAEDFASLDLFDKSFLLGGFGTVAGASFVIDPNATPSAVPLPAGVWLMLAGLGALGLARRRRRPVTRRAAPT